MQRILPKIHQPGPDGLRAPQSTVDVDSTSAPVLRECHN